MQVVGISIYFLALLVIFGVLLVLGYIATHSTHSSLDFLISGRNMGLLLCTMAVAGEWLGGTSTVGVSEIAYNHGFASFAYNIGSAFGMMIFGLVMASHYRKLQVRTVPEMIENLFNRKTRIVSAVFLSVGYFVLAIAQLAAVGSIMAAAINVDPIIATLITGIFLTLLLTSGGLWFAALSNFTKFILGYATLLIALFFGLVYIGGYPGLFEALPSAVAPIYFSPIGDIPQLAFEWLLGGAFGALAAQASIQPIFGAKDVKTARRASLITPMVVAPMGVICATLGMIAYAVDPSITNPKLALPLLLMNTSVIPQLLGAITLAAIFALIAGTLTSVLLAIGSMISHDIYPILARKTQTDDATNSRSLVVSRGSTLIAGVIATFFAIFMPNILDTSYVSYALRSAAAIIVIGGIYFKGRVSSKAAIATLIISLVATLGWYLLGSPFGISKVEIALISAILSLLIASIVWRPHQ